MPRLSQMPKSGSYHQREFVGERLSHLLSLVLQRGKRSETRDC